MRKIRTIKTALPSLANDDEASAALQEAIGRNNEVEALEIKRKASLARVNKEYNKLVRPLYKDGITKATFVVSYLEDNRERLIEASQSKTVNFRDSGAKWRLDPPSLVIVNKAKAVKRMLQRELNDLLVPDYQIKKNPTKEHIKKTGKRIPGLKIVQEEELTLFAKNGEYRLKRSEIPKLILQIPPA